MDSGLESGRQWFIYAIVAKTNGRKMKEQKESSIIQDPTPLMLLDEETKGKD